MPEGTSIETTDAATAKVEAWLREQPEAKIVTSYIGQGSPRFFISYNPELPDPAFAKIVILTPDAESRDRLKLRLRARVAQGLAPEALVRVTQFVFGPFVPYPVAFRVMGPDADKLRGIADQVTAVMRANPNMRQVTQDWGPRAPTAHFAPRSRSSSPDRPDAERRGATAPIPAVGSCRYPGPREHPHGGRNGASRGFRAPRPC